MHRGPDEEGYTLNESISLGFGFSLSFDIEMAINHYLMKEERYWIIFIGEVYN